MPRSARIVIPGLPHHVIQRGNRRQRVFFGPDDYRAYLRIAAEEFGNAGLEAWAYCLMPNHVHLIVCPLTERSLAEGVGRTHLRFTRRINEREKWNGFLWQGRFGSFPMGESYLRTCLRYVVLNPVRSGLVEDAARWPWSSVRTHLQGTLDPLIQPAPIFERFGGELPALFEAEGKEDRALMRSAIARSTPLGVTS